MFAVIIVIIIICVVINDPTVIFSFMGYNIIRITLLK